MGTSSDPEAPFDALVIGAGFGGMGAALRLAERGARVLMLERLNYPGGCASTFRRGGYQFESGATLSSGFGERQLFTQWIEQHRIPLQWEVLRPVIRFRSPDLTLDVGPDRQTLVEAFQLQHPDRATALGQFFRHQQRVAEVLWRIMDDPTNFPPLSWTPFWRHVRRAPAYLSLLRDLGRPLAHTLRRFRLHDLPTLSLYCDALCQITLQCDHRVAEAPLALAALDYPFQGVAHVRGGLGALARGICDAFERAGGRIAWSSPVRRLQRDGSLWTVETPRGSFWGRHVVANLLPETVQSLTPGLPLPRRLTRIGTALRESGYGACMLYRVVRVPPDEASEAQHWQFPMSNSDHPRLVEGHHLFCSVSSAHESERAPIGHRTLTVSTHVPMETWLSKSDADRARYVDEIQERMRAGLREVAPSWMNDTVVEWPASPRTFARFVGRPDGLVGGLPRTSGLHNYTGLRAQPAAKNLWLVGDSHFPGQSTLATAIGGHRVADRIL